MECEFTLKNRLNICSAKQLVRSYFKENYEIAWEFSELCEYEKYSKEVMNKSKKKILITAPPVGSKVYGTSISVFFISCLGGIFMTIIINNKRM